MCHSCLPHIAQLALPLFLLSGVIASAQPTPPVADPIDHREERHGATVIDNYYWLREKSNPKVVAYLESENAYTKAMTADLAPFQDALYKEMLGRVKQTDLSVPVRRGEYLYYSRTEEGKQYPIQCRRHGNMGAPEEILLDPNELAKSHKFVGLGAFVVSDDANMLAYSMDFTGFRQYGLQVKNLRTGETLPDTFERVDSVVWAADNKTLLLTTEDAVTKRSDKLWRHALGGAFDPVYEEKDELYDIGLERTRDKKYIFLTVGSKDTTEFRFLRADQPQGSFMVFLPREKKHRYYVDHRDNLFYIRTNKPGRNFAIMTAPESDPAPKNWKVFIPQEDDALLEHLDLFEDFAVAVTRSEAVDHVRVYDFHRAKWTAIQFPEPVYAASPGGTPDFDSKDLSLQLSEPGHASQCFRLRRPYGQVHAPETPGSARWVRSQAVRLRAPLGYRARRREGTGLYRLSQGLRARRPLAIVPLCLRIVWHRHARYLQQQSPQPARPRDGLRHRPHSRR